MSRLSRGNVTTVAVETRLLTMHGLLIAMLVMLLAVLTAECDGIEREVDADQ